MKNIILTGFFLFSGPACATEILDNKSALDYIVRFAEQRPAMGKLSYYVFRYNAKKFSIDKAVKDLNYDYNIKGQKNRSGCHYNIITGSRKNMSILIGDNSGQSYTRKIAELLETLDQQGQMVTIISALWDGTSRTLEGGAGSCMIYEFNAYTVDGFKLTLEFNQID